MDGGVELTPDEVRGRNTWMVWHRRQRSPLGQIDGGQLWSVRFLKTLSSHPGLPASRDNRWQYLGLINDPCFVKADGPDPKRYGLWLDQRRPDCAPDPFENEQNSPGVRTGARGRNIPAGSYYGYATGIIGLRLFPNPNFDEAAAKRWDAVR